MMEEPNDKKPESAKEHIEEVSKIIKKHAIQQKDILKGQIERALNFHKSLVKATPRVWITSSIVIINALVFIAMIASGASFFEPSKEQLANWGAYMKPYISIHEWWRLVSCAFVHSGIIHLMVNICVLWDVGRIVERLLGNVIFLIIYMLCAIGGSIASIILNPAVFSAGASGAIFGLFGALVSYSLCHKGIIPGRIYRKLLVSTVAFLLFNLIYGLITQSVNNALNVGGLVMGFILGALFSKPLHERIAKSLVK